MLTPTIRFLIRLVPILLLDILFLLVAGVTATQMLVFEAQWVMVLLVVEILEEMVRAQ